MSSLLLEFILGFTCLIPRTEASTSAISASLDSKSGDAEMADAIAYEGRGFGDNLVTVAAYRIVTCSVVTFHICAV
jgi:hypothetical protein